MALISNLIGNKHTNQDILNPPEPKVVTFKPSSQDQRNFILSKKFIVVIFSSRGEGKTVGGLFAAIKHAQDADKNDWPLRWALVRDTRRNIGISTARTIREWFPPPYSHWKGRPDEPETITILIGNEPAIIFDCFGVNTPEDLSRFQSYEASGGVWIEEPAAAATNSEFTTTGINETVLAVAITSVRGAKHPRIQLSFNPPPADHWTAQLWHLPGFEDYGDIEEEMSVEQREAREGIRQQSDVFWIPPGANKALDEKTPGYRERNRMALMAAGRGDLLARLVEGRVGYAKIGEAVTPGFSGEHIAQGLQVLPNRPFFIGLDAGLQPACVIAQVAPSGHLFIHAGFGLENVGMEQLIDRRLRPWLQQYPEVRSYIWIGGHEFTQREQSNSEQTALKTIISKLGGRFIRGPVSWGARRDACHEALAKYLGTIPWVRIDPKDSAQLVRCLDGAWHYDADISGKVRRELPSKVGLMPSLGDAFAHLVAVLLHRSPQRVGNQRPADRRADRAVLYAPYAGSSRGRTGA